MEGRPKVFVENGSELRAWLEAYHDKEQSVWLVKWKKTAGQSFISYEEIVQELLCFGWVDSLARKLDAEKTMLLISPRSPKSNWSASNKDRIKRLMAEGRMAAAGLKSVEVAKENGRWNFLDEVEALIVPPDLEEALAVYPKASYYYQRFPDSSKRGILEWIKNAKRPETRAKRIRETAEKAAVNLKANHPEGRNFGPAEA